MPFSSWRGMVGVIKPTMRPGSLEEMIRLLPEGVGVIPHLLDAQGTLDSFSEAIPAYEAGVARLAAQEPDLIHASGEPPFMLLGADGERRLIKRWERAHEIPITTSGIHIVEALRALNVRRFVGLRGTTWDQQNVVARYFQEFGFDVLGMEHIDVAWQNIGQLSPEEVYGHAKRAFLKYSGVEGIYMMGSTGRMATVVDKLEQDLQVPVVHVSGARLWGIQKRLGIHHPVTGYGRLLSELP